MQQSCAPPSHEELDEFIDTILLGHGFDAIEWQQRLTQNGFSWTHHMRNYILKREFRFFRSEIELLISEDPRPTVLGGRSNSCKSVLMKIKGELGEREQRLLEARLFGPEAKLRTFEEYVKKWRAQVSSSNSTLSKPSPRETVDTTATQTEYLDVKSPISESPSTISPPQILSNFNAGEPHHSESNIDFINPRDLLGKSSTRPEQKTGNSMQLTDSGDYSSMASYNWSDTVDQDGASDLFSSQFYSRGTT